MPDSSFPRHDLDGLRPPRDLRGIAIRGSRLEEANLLAEISARELGPDSADRDTVRRVMTFSTECFFTVVRSSARQQAPEVVGFFAFLLLKRCGLDALLQARFDGLKPDIHALCLGEEGPAAIYFWAAVAKRAMRIAFPAVVEQLKAPRYRRLDIYSRGTTLGGAHALVNLGFLPVHSGNDPMTGSLLVYRRRVSDLAA